ncbi:hypothetical protein AWRI1631_161800 [Saccharomyces cerevisiae AWRI1631]|uniref:Uncharacterized protein n=1 Tax=Saccharomyces cerevisiae (strain AWRI1631) TaxID=545124 RepID=B5VT80_YEAS6|nr:hypothetical protein AWRI1631_161800 [Saccharomyces cerevisiae AWRI1631]
MKIYLLLLETMRNFLGKFLTVKYHRERRKTACRLVLRK